MTQEARQLDKTAVSKTASASGAFNNEDLSHIGFYAARQIQREIPRIVGRRAAVMWTLENAERLRESGDATDEAIAKLIETTLQTRDQGLAEGQIHDVFLPTPEHSEDTVILPRPIPHHSWRNSGSRYTQKHRYNFIEALLRDPKDTNELETLQHNIQVRCRLAK